MRKELLAMEYSGGMQPEGIFLVPRFRLKEEDNKTAIPNNPSCSCGAAKQTMSHIVNDCPLSRFSGGLATLHLAGDEAIKWLGMQCKFKYCSLNDNALNTLG